MHTQQDNQADAVIDAMLAAAAPSGTLRADAQVAEWATALADNVLAIGACYGYALTAGRARNLIANYFAAVTVDTVLPVHALDTLSCVFRFVPAAHLLAVAACNVASASSIAFAIGQTSKQYFGAALTADDFAAMMRGAIRAAAG